MFSISFMSFFPVGSVELDKESFDKTGTVSKVVIISAGVLNNILLCSLVYFYFSLPISLFSIGNNGLGITAYCSTSNLRGGDILNGLDRDLGTMDILTTVTFESHIKHSVYNKGDIFDAFRLIQRELACSEYSLRFQVSQASILDKSLKLIRVSENCGTHYTFLDQVEDIRNRCRFEEYRRQRSIASGLVTLLEKFLRYVFTVSFSMALCNCLPLKCIRTDGYLLLHTLTMAAETR